MPRLFAGLSARRMAVLCDAKVVEQQAIERLKNLFDRPVWNDDF